MQDNPRMALASAVLIIAGSLLTGCGDDAAAQCEQFNWRAPSTGVTCRGVAGCLCSGGTVCSVEVTDKTTNPWTLTASCTALSAAKDMAFACDGPEDCSADQVCCANLNVGGGSTCMAKTACSGIGEQRVLCREEKDCTFPGHTCKPAANGSFFDGTAGFCD